MVKVWLEPEVTVVALAGEIVPPTLAEGVMVGAVGADPNVGGRGLYKIGTGGVVVGVIGVTGVVVATGGTTVDKEKLIISEGTE